MEILHLDSNHPLLIDQLTAMGFCNQIDYTSSKQEIEKRIHEFDGLIIRSRFSIDKSFLDKATRLKFIGRVGAGLENIDVAYASSKNIELIAAPEGNRNAVGEHTLGMLLSLMNNFRKADNEVRKGIWLREENRGEELEDKTIGLIGYGNTGKAFSRKLKGFNVKVLCYDIKESIGDEYATQVSLQELQKHSDVLSLHVPLTDLTKNMVDSKFISQFAKPIWFMNTARGQCVVTKDLVDALQSGKIKGAGLDVIEYEKSSFEDMINENDLPKEFQYLIQTDNVILTPHIAGWTIESKEKLAQIIVDKIKVLFC